MKYYFYISETKVNMLYDQMGLEEPISDTQSTLRENLTYYFSKTELKNLCFDLQVDYEILPGDDKSSIARELISYMRRRGKIEELLEKLRQERPHVEWTDSENEKQFPSNSSSHYSKLETVLDYLEKHQKVGSVESPKAYFKGELILRWGEFSGTGLVYFTGMVGETLIGLGGSLNHVIGNKPIDKLGSSGSRTAGIQRSLIEELELEPLIDTINQQDRINKERLLADSEEGLIWAIENACGNITGPRNRLEFVARRLWESSHIPDWLGAVQRDPYRLGLSDSPGESNHTYYEKVLLASPIYMAYVD